MYIKDKISSYQLFTLLTSFLFGSSLVFNPAISAKSDAWLAFIIGLFLGSILIMIYIGIYKLNPEMTLVAILKKNFGKTFGTLLSIVYIWYFIHLSGLVLRTFGEYSLTVTYKQTPIIFIMCCLALVFTLAVRSGIETLGRVSEIYLFIVVVAVVYATVVITTSFQFGNLKPFLSNGLKPVLMSSIGVATLPLGESIAFLMILPNINKQKKTASTWLISVLFYGFFMFVITVRNIMVLGGNLAARDFFSSVIILKMLPGVESVTLLDINYIMEGVIKTGILLYAATTGIAEVMKIKEYKPFVFPVSFIIISLSIWLYDNFFEVVQWATQIYPIYSSIFQFVIPVIILIVSLVKRNLNEN